MYRLLFRALYNVVLADTVDFKIIREHINLAKEQGAVFDTMAIKEASRQANMVNRMPISKIKRKEILDALDVYVKAAYNVKQMLELSGKDFKNG